MAELADALDSKSSGFALVPVRVRPSAPFDLSDSYESFSFFESKLPAQCTVCSDDGRLFVCSVLVLDNLSTISHLSVAISSEVPLLRKRASASTQLAEALILCRFNGRKNETYSAENGKLCRCATIDKKRINRI